MESGEIQLKTIENERFAGGQNFLAADNHPACMSVYKEPSSRETATNQKPQRKVKLPRIAAPKSGYAEDSLAAEFPLGVL